MRYHLTPVRVAAIKTQEIISVVEDVEKREYLCTFGGNVNWYIHYKKQYGDFTSKLKIELLYDPSIPLLAIFPKEIKSKF